MGRWLRHRLGGVGVRSERPSITGAMGPSMSWDPWPRPVVRAGVGGAEVYTDWRKWALGATRLTRRVRPLVTSRWRRWCKMRFSVRVRTQNALFRRVRFSSPAQTWSHLTERRILRRRSHVKAQSAPATSRKGALYGRPTRKMRLSVTSPVQNAPFRELPVAEWGTCVHCCDASRRDINPH